MGEYRVSTRYATSLLELAEEKNQFDVVSKDVELIFASMAQAKDLRKVLENPVISADKKSAILNEIFEKKVNKTTLDFLRFVVSKSREDLLFDIVERYVEIYNEKIGLVKVTVTSAVDLNDDQKKTILTKLKDITKKEVDMKYLLNDSIIGGFLVRIGDTVMDASLRHQLDVLRKTLLSETESVN